LNTTIESTQKAAHILKTQFPEVEKVVTKIGSGEVPTDPMAMDASDMMVVMKDKQEWKNAKTFNEMSAKMSKALEDIPGITASFQFPVQMRFNELMTGARQDVVCKIFGENLDTLARYAEKLGKVIKTVEGTQNLYIEPVTGMPQVVIEYNRNIIAQYHLTIDDINKVINTAFAGQSTGLVFEGEKRFDLVVRLNNNQRKDIEDVQNLLIPTPQGTQIPLSQLANVSIKNGPNQIQREDAKRRIVVGFNVRGRDVQSIVNELQQKVDNQIKYPAGYYTTYGGAFENLNKAKARLMIAVPVSLFFAFNSVRQGLLIYSAIPLSAIGGILFLALRGMPFSISAGVGFIALFGVAVLNGIVLISEFNQLKSEGMTDLHRIVIMGTKVRLRPVLMTAFVASLGFLPMAVSNGAGAEVQRPLATVVIGGLMIATFLTLFVLPILYVTFEKGFSLNPFKKKITTLIILSIFSFNMTTAQTPITLKKSLEIALKNNYSIKSERLKSDYQQKLIKTATNIAPTNIIGDYGQINSIYNDTRFGISQLFNFPTIYNRQKKLYTEEWKTSALNVTVKEAELKREVTKTFYTLIYLNEKEKLLMKSDTIFAEFLRKSELRFKKGESNVLEKTTANTQRGTVKMQLIQLREEKELVQNQFQLLLNSEEQLVPKIEVFKLVLDKTIDSTLVAQHPNLNFLEQQKKVRLASTKLEKSKLLPILTLGYNSTSITGTGADNVLYDKSNRFQSAQFGIGIPLFGGSQKAKIDASKIDESLSQNELEKEKQILQKQFKTVFNKYNSSIEKLDYYEKTALPNAETIIKTANLQFLNGEINYLDWVMLINQSITIKSDYIDTVLTHNESVIQLNYLISKQ
jgi:cobalt-zinc-cadmium resistance protein CzcA